MNDATALSVTLHVVGAALLAALSGSGCTLLIPGATPHDIALDADKQEHRRCDTDPVDPRLYSPGIVESVSPYYRHVMGGPNGSEAHFAGARLELRPLPGVTAELLERGLMCRSAELMLGHAVPHPNEPYFLKDAWVSFHVQSGGGAFAVNLVAEDDEHGREIYTRAVAFARGAPGPDSR
jgi:hypothetical protein